MVLKLGSNGEHVKALQTYLNLKADGEFGPKTESAVKKWQTNRGLTADGIVGPKTWDAMGIATTDLTEIEQPGSSGLVFKKEHLPAGEYMKGPTTKSWIFLHHTAGWNDPFATIRAWGRDTRGCIATEWVLGGQKITDGNTVHDGVLVQAFPEGGYGWHLGTGNNIMHRNSVGMELCNFGYLTKGGYSKWNAKTKKTEWISLKADQYYTYVGTEANSEQIVFLNKPFRGYTAWHRYSAKQIEVLRDWIIYIANRDNIDPRKGLIQEIKSKGAHAAFDLCDVKLCERTPGMWLHTNVQLGKQDLFPQEDLIEMLTSI
jgi:hypothetical protein